MRKNILLSSFLLLLFSPILQAANSIQYKTESWDAILERAHLEQKPIFVKAYADYCMPCKLMDQTVFADKDIVDFFNTHFINFKVDMQTPTADVFNVAYGVQILPSLLFFDKNGKVVQLLEGTLTVDELLTLAQFFSYENQQIIPETEIITKASPEPTEFPYSTLSYMEAASQANLKVNSLKNHLDNDDSLLEIFEMASFMKAKAIDLMVSKPSLFIKRFGKHAYYNKITESGHLALEKAIEYKDTALFNKSIDILTASKHPNTDKLNLEWSATYYAGINDWDAYTAVHYKSRNNISKKVLRLALEKIATKAVSSKNLKKAYKLAKNDLHHKRLQSVFYYKLK